MVHENYSTAVWPTRDDNVDVKVLQLHRNLKF